MEEIMEWIHNRIHKHNKNFLCVICGETGSGKSYSALRICELLDPEFSIEQVAFSPQEFMALLNSGKLHKGNFLLVDEAGVTLPSRQWWSFTNRALNYILQTFRRENLGVIFTLPDLSMLDSQARKLFHMYIETERILPEQEQVLVKLFFCQNQPKLGKVYFKYPRLVDDKGQIIRYDGFYIGLPSEKLIKDYEEKKKVFAETLKQDLLAEATKLQQESKQVSSDEYFDSILDDAKARWQEFVSRRKIDRQRYIDRYKLKSAYPELSMKKLPILRGILSLNLEKK